MSLALPVSVNPLDSLTLKDPSFTFFSGPSVLDGFRNAFDIPLLMDPGTKIEPSCDQLGANFGLVG